MTRDAEPAYLSLLRALKGLLEGRDDPALKRDLSSPETYEGLRSALRRVGGKLAGAYGERATELALVAPDVAVLLGRVVADGRVPKRVRGELLASIVYVVLPFDLVPEALFGLLGAVDDIAVITRALHVLFNEVDPLVVRELWPGKGETLDRIQALARDLHGLFKQGLARGLGKLVRRGAETLVRELRAGMEEARKALPGTPPT